MRAKEFIIEAAYDGIRDRLLRQYPDWAQYINEQTAWAKQTLVKPDRVIWWLKITEKEIAEAGNEPGRAQLTQGGMRQALAHFMTIQYQPIQDYVFGNQHFHQVAAALHDLEDRYRKRTTQDSPVAIQSGDKVIRDFGDGYQWVYTNRAYCPDEGRSGRHCGNVVGQDKPDQRIISLRKNGQVRATFILEPNGQLGEMKGVGNSKPGSNLHPYIMWLLEQKFIKGIQGGGYAPGQNFSIADLDDAQQQHLRNVRPDLDIDSDLNRQIVAITYKNKSIIEEIWQAINDELLEMTGYNWYAKGASEGNGNRVEDFIEYADIMAEYEDADDASEVFSFKDIPKLFKKNIFVRLEYYEDEGDNDIPYDALDTMYNIIKLMEVDVKVDHQKRTGSWSLLRDEEPIKTGRFRF